MKELVELTENQRTLLEASRGNRPTPSWRALNELQKLGLVRDIMRIGKCIDGRWDYNHWSCCLTMEGHEALRCGRYLPGGGSIRIY